MAVTVSNNNVVKLTAALDTYGPCRVRRIRWVMPTTAAHKCTLLDSPSGGGAIAYDAVCAAANFALESDFTSAPLDFPKGLQLSVLGSGIVYLYLA